MGEFAQARVQTVQDPGAGVRGMGRVAQERLGVDAGLGVRGAYDCLSRSAGCESSTAQFTVDGRGEGIDGHEREGGVEIQGAVGQPVQDGAGGAGEVGSVRGGTGGTRSDDPGVAHAVLGPTGGEVLQLLLDDGLTRSAHVEEEQDGRVAVLDFFEEPSDADTRVVEALRVGAGTGEVQAPAGAPDTVTGEVQDERLCLAVPTQLLPAFAQPRTARLQQRLTRVHSRAVQCPGQLPQSGSHRRQRLK